MNKPATFIKVAFGMSILLLIQGCSPSPQQVRMDAQQQLSLNSAFSQILRKQDDEVRVVSKVGNRLTLMPGPRNLIVGSQFKMIDRHFRFSYRVKSIQGDGIIITYEGDAWHDGEVAGQVKLNWKP